MKKKSSSKKHLNWVNIIFFPSVFVIAIVGTISLCAFKAIPWQTWVLTVAYMISTGLAITAGYHRLLAHKSYQATRPLRLLFLLFGAAAFEGSALEWCSDHRNHHRYTDTDKDPYNINKGFWYAHIGWLFYLDSKKYDFSNIEDLTANKLLRWQHKYYLWIAIFMGFILPMAIASLWGNPLGGLIIAGALRMTINHHATFAINSICHYFGKSTYSTRVSARDNWLTSLLTYGEGFHNFHHQFPRDYRNGIRVYHYDPTKWLIKFLSWFGLAHNLQRIPADRIAHYREQRKKQANASH